MGFLQANRMGSLGLLAPRNILVCSCECSHIGLMVFCRQVDASCQVSGYDRSSSRSDIKRKNQSSLQMSLFPSISLSTNIGEVIQSIISALDFAVHLLTRRGNGFTPRAALLARSQTTRAEKDGMFAGKNGESCGKLLETMGTLLENMG